MSIIVVGAGGHARVIIEILKECGEKVTCCVANQAPTVWDQTTPIEYGNARLKTLRDEGHTKIFIAIGDNKLRCTLSEMAAQLNYEFINVISKHAIISPSTELGQGLCIMPGCIINTGVTINDFAIINTGAIVDHDCQIGRYVHLAPQATLAGNVRIAEGTLLGVGSKVIPNVNIGSWSVVGAGGVVISDLPANSKAMGVPAKTVAQK